MGEIGSGIMLITLCRDSGAVGGGRGLEWPGTDNNRDECEQ